MSLPFLTAEPVMVLLTRCANRYEARSAPENAISRTRFKRVDLGTPRSGAVPELPRIAVKVVEEGDLQQVFDLGRKEEALYDRDGDWNTTHTLIAHTGQGELLGIGGGEEEVAKATVTIGVAAIQTIRLVDDVVTDWAGLSVLELVLGSNGVR